jgi:hypothetical protein
MADLAQLLSNAAQTNADFDLGKLNKSYWEGQDQAFNNDLRAAFRPTPENPDGVPMKDGQPDFAAIAKTLFQKGDIGRGVATANLDFQRQNLRDDAQFFATGGRPSAPQIVSPPSSSRSNGATATVMPPLNKGGVVPQGGGQQQAPQGGTTVMQVLSAQGIPNNQLEAASASVARQLGLDDPNAPIDIQDPQVRNVLVPAVQQLKRMGIGQVAQPGQPTQQDIPQAGVQPQPAPPQAAPQAAPAPSAPNPFANAQAQGLIPPGIDPLRYVAGLKLRAGASPNPQTQQFARQELEAIRKASEPTAEEKAFAASRRNPNLDNYTAQTEADKASAKAVAEGDVKEQQEYIDAGRAASRRLTTLNSILDVANNDKNVGFGFGADTELKIKMGLERLGFNFGDLSGSQLLQKMNATLAAETIKGMSSRGGTQMEFKTFLANNPGLLMDKTGTIRLASIFAQVSKREYDLGKLARQNRDNWANWDNVVEKYDAGHQIIDPISKRPIFTNSIVAPGPSNAGNGAPRPALEPGKTMVNGYVFKGGDPKNRANWELRS